MKLRIAKKILKNAEGYNAQQIRKATSVVRKYEQNKPAEAAE